MDRKLVLSNFVVNFLESNCKTTFVGALTVDLADTDWGRLNWITRNAVWSKTDTVRCGEYESVPVVQPHVTAQADMIVID